MKVRKCLSSNQRKRTLHRNKVRLANRRHTQFSVDQYSNEESNAHNELESS
jgi:hypothetical protein